MQQKNDQCTEIMIAKIEQFFKDMIIFVRTFSKSSTKPKPQNPHSYKIKKPSFNAYLLYFQENHKKVAQANPKLIHSEITAQVGANWQCLPSEEKQIYFSRSLEKKRKYLTKLKLLEMQKEKEKESNNDSDDEENHEEIIENQITEQIESPQKPKMNQKIKKSSKSNITFA